MAGEGGDHESKTGDEVKPTREGQEAVEAEKKKVRRNREHINILFAVAFFSI